MALVHSCSLPTDTQNLWVECPKLNLIFTGECLPKSNHLYTVEIICFKMLNIKFQKLQISSLDLRLNCVGSFNNNETLWCLYSLRLFFPMRNTWDHPSFWQWFYSRACVSTAVHVRVVSRRFSRTDLHWVESCAPSFCQIIRDCVLDKTAAISS